MTIPSEVFEAEATRAKKLENDYSAFCKATAEACANEASDLVIDTTKWLKLRTTAEVAHMNLDALEVYLRVSPTKNDLDRFQRILEQWKVAYTETCRQLAVDFGRSTIFARNGALTDVCVLQAKIAEMERFVSILRAATIPELT